MKIKKLINIVIIAATVSFATQSCTGLLTADVDEALLNDEVFRNLDDADAALRGIYGKMMDVANQYIVLNELRADLMDVTYNADLSLIEIAEHRTVSDNNEWANPKAFFSLINSCNEAIYNYNEMVKDSRIAPEQYYVRYSDVVAIRSWAYLQVALHFADKEKGGVPYITKPLNDVESLSSESLSQFPYLDLSTMIDSLLITMENLPFKKITNDEALITSIDGYQTQYMFIDKEYFLGELNLWKGNYQQAAVYFKTIMERGEGTGAVYDLYKLPFDASATLEQSSSQYNSGYVRFYNNDRMSAKNMWPYMFFETQTNNYEMEWLWVLYFDEISEPNTFINLFAKEGGEYLLKPSQAAIDNWNNQVQRNNFVGDMRGYFPNLYGLPGSYDMVGEDPVIMKQIYNYTAYDPNFDPLEKKGKWHLWRAGGLHLRYAEAANRDGQTTIAYAIMNNGIAANYPGTDPEADANDFTQRNQTFLEFPYDFDARSTNVYQSPPNLRQPWFRNVGVRGRVYLQPKTIEGDSLMAIEEDILEECALELAFEGERWGDLVRLSMRNGDNAILADKIADKLNKAGKDGEAVRTLLMDQNNWFLPLKY